MRRLWSAFSAAISGFLCNTSDCRRKNRVRRAYDWFLDEWECY